MQCSGAAVHSREVLLKLENQFRAAISRIFTLGAHFRHRNLHQNAGKKHGDRIFLAQSEHYIVWVYVFDEEFEYICRLTLILKD